MKNWIVRCRITFSLAGSFTTGMLLQIVLAVNHLILIVWPLRHRRLMAGKNVKTALILSWLSPPFVQMIKSTALAPDDQGLFKNCQHAYTNQKLFKDTWTLFLFGFISTIVVIYSHIIEVVRKRKQAWRSMSQDGTLEGSPGHGYSLLIFRRAAEKPEISAGFRNEDDLHDDNDPVHFYILLDDVGPGHDVHGTTGWDVPQHALLLPFLVQMDQGRYVRHETDREHNRILDENC